MLKATLIQLYFSDDNMLVLGISPWILASLLLILAWIVYKWWWRSFRRFDLVSLNVELGGVGKVEFRPNVEDIQIAHRLWTELVTRKAALPIDPENDVIIEIYDSWYALFLRVRQLLGDIPGHLVRRDKSTRELVRIATETLNSGLRPHLTQWQARFRNWYAHRLEDLKNKTPQEVQREFPEYEFLISDMRRVNEQLVQYAGELQKVVRGS